MPRDCSQGISPYPRAFLRVTTVGDQGLWVSPAGSVGAAALQLCPGHPHPLKRLAELLKFAHTHMKLNAAKEINNSNRRLRRNQIHFRIVFKAHQCCQRKNPDPPILSEAHQEYCGLFLMCCAEEQSHHCGSLG